jgi:hypothetical protein
MAVAANLPKNLRLVILFLRIRSSPSSESANAICPFSMPVMLPRAAGIVQIFSLLAKTRLFWPPRRDARDYCHRRVSVTGVNFKKNLDMTLFLFAARAQYARIDIQQQATSAQAPTIVRHQQLLRETRKRPIAYGTGVGDRPRDDTMGGP